MNLDITTILGIPFTGIQVRKSMTKRQALQLVLGVLDDAGLSAQVFSKAKPNLSKMTDKEVDNLFIKLKTLVNT